MSTMRRALLSSAITLFVASLASAQVPPRDQGRPALPAVGTALVLELLLEGRIMDADEAERRGLVNRVVADADLEAEVKATAGRIAEGAPLANRATKRILRRLLQQRRELSPVFLPPYRPLLRRRPHRSRLRHRLLQQFLRRLRFLLPSRLHRPLSLLSRR